MKWIRNTEIIQKLHSILSFCSRLGFNIYFECKNISQFLGNCMNWTIPRTSYCFFSLKYFPVRVSNVAMWNSHNHNHIYVFQLWSSDWNHFYNGLFIVDKQDHMCSVSYLAHRNIEKKMNDLTFESLRRKVATSLLNFPFPGLASLSRWSHCPPLCSSSCTRGTWPSSWTRRGGATRGRRSSRITSSVGSWEGSWAPRGRRGRSTTGR